MNDLTDTLNNGETEVLVVPKGEFYGSDSKGNPIPESIDEKVIDNLEAQLQGKELLVDKDHSSMKEGSDKDTSAMGWMHSFKKGVEGLWAKIQWTNIGRNLVENRVFRFLSPVFTLKGDKPTNMLNVALTNQPAFQEMAKPIINNQPTMETITMEMTKEELVQLIKDTIAELKTEEAVKKVEEQIENENEVHEDIVENLEDEKKAIESGVIQNSEPTAKTAEVEDGEQVADEKKPEETTTENAATTQNACGEDSDKSESNKSDNNTDEVNNGEQVANEEVIETTDDDDEVIKIETLNSQPKTEGIDIVKNSSMETLKAAYDNGYPVIVTRVG